MESPEEVSDELVRAADFIPKERLGATDDCGFSPFSIDEKPNHGSPDFAREVAFQKITNRVEGTQMAAEELGRLLTDGDVARSILRSPAAPGQLRADGGHLLRRSARCQASRGRRRRAGRRPCRCAPR